MKNSTVRNLILSIALIVILIIIAAVVIFRVTDSGKTGKPGTSETAGQTQIASPTQAPVEAIPDDDSDQIVEMEKEKAKPEESGKVIGEKTAVSSKVILTNNTAFEIISLFLRSSDGPKTENAWGKDLFENRITLKDKEQVTYYYSEPDSASGRASSYDIRMVVSFGGSSSVEEIENVPFTGIKEIILRLDVSGDSGVGYAEYIDADGKKNSTRNGHDSVDEEEQTSTPTPVPETSSEIPDDPTQAPEPQDEEDTEIFSDDAISAVQYIGQPFGNLESVFGSPSGGSDYEEEPDTGMTGYHFYDTFTVSTTVDENGNEVVSGIW